MTNNHDDKKQTKHEEHPDFDGIKENENPIPLWFNLLLIFTVAFSIVYMIYYHVINDSSVMDSEKLGVSENAAQSSSSSVDYKSLIANAQIVEEGKNIYVTNCASCHGDKGQGGVGPNLTDDFWITGNTYADVNKVISEGVISKGMPGWKSILGDKKIQELVAYIGAIQGTNPAGAKASEGKAGKLH